MNSEDLSNISLADVVRLGDIFGLPGLANSILRRTASTYEQFVDVLYKDLDEIVSIFQENPELRFEDTEDRLTIEIVSNLRSMGYNAGHETKVGGHADILVRGKGNSLWIGEAKIHNGYDYLFKGFQQLCTRYSTGDISQDCGGLLIYVKNKDFKSVIDSWKQDIEGRGLDGFSMSDCSNRANFSFFTEHKHERSGTAFKVRHLGISLYFSPRDRGKVAKSS